MILGVLCLSAARRSIFRRPVCFQTGWLCNRCTHFSHPHSVDNVVVYCLCPSVRFAFLQSVRYGSSRDAHRQWWQSYTNTRPSAGLKTFLMDIYTAWNTQERHGHPSIYKPVSYKARSWVQVRFLVTAADPINASWWRKTECRRISYRPAIYKYVIFGRTGTYISGIGQPRTISGLTVRKRERNILPERMYVTLVTALPASCQDIERVTSIVAVGVVISDRVTVTDHVSSLLESWSRHCLV